jgi:hypothetical protein
MTLDQIHDRDSPRGTHRGHRKDRQDNAASHLRQEQSGRKKNAKAHNGFQGGGRNRGSERPEPSKSVQREHRQNDGRDDAPPCRERPALKCYVTSTYASSAATLSPFRERPAFKPYKTSTYASSAATLSPFKSGSWRGFFDRRRYSRPPISSRKLDILFQSGSWRGFFERRRYSQPPTSSRKLDVLCKGGVGGGSGE